MNTDALREINKMYIRPDTVVVKYPPNVPVPIPEDCFPSEGFLGTQSDFEPQVIFKEDFDCRSGISLEEREFRTVYFPNSLNILASLERIYPDLNNDVYLENLITNSNLDEGILASDVKYLSPSMLYRLLTDPRVETIDISMEWFCWYRLVLFVLHNPSMIDGLNVNVIFKLATYINPELWCQIGNDAYDSSIIHLRRAMQDSKDDLKPVNFYDLLKAMRVLGPANVLLQKFALHTSDIDTSTACDYFLRMHPMKWLPKTIEPNDNERRLSILVVDFIERYGHNFDTRYLIDVCAYLGHFVDKNTHSRIYKYMRQILPIETKPEFINTVTKINHINHRGLKDLIVLSYPDSPIAVFDPRLIVDLVESGYDPKALFKYSRQDITDALLRTEQSHVQQQRFLENAGYYGTNLHSAIRTLYTQSDGILDEGKFLGCLRRFNHMLEAIEMNEDCINIGLYDVESLVGYPKSFNPFSEHPYGGLHISFNRFDMNVVELRNYFSLVDTLYQDRNIDLMPLDNAVAIQHDKKLYRSTIKLLVELAQQTDTSEQHRIDKFYHWMHRQNKTLDLQVLHDYLEKTLLCAIFRRFHGFAHKNEIELIKRLGVDSLQMYISLCEHYRNDNGKIDRHSLIAFLDNLNELIDRTDITYLTPSVGRLGQDVILFINVWNTLSDAGFDLLEDVNYVPSTSTNSVYDRAVQTMLALVHEERRLSLGQNILADELARRPSQCKLDIDTVCEVLETALMRSKFIPTPIQKNTPDWDVQQTFLEERDKLLHRDNDIATLDIAVDRETLEQWGREYRNCVGSTPYVSLADSGDLFLRIRFDEYWLKNNNLSKHARGFLVHCTSDLSRIVEAKGFLNRALECIELQRLDEIISQLRGKRTIEFTGHSGLL